MAETYKFYNEWFQPATDGGADLGHPSFRWNDLYLKGAVTIAGSATISVLKVLDQTNFVFNNDQIISHNDDLVFAL